MTSTNDAWKPSINHKAPPAEIRAAEKKDRATAIAGDIKRLKERISLKPNEADTAAFHKKLKDIAKHQGWTPEVELVFGTRDINSILRKQDTLPKNLLPSFIQLKKDLAKRDIDVIFVPLAPTPHVYGHKLIDGITAEHEYTPGWTKMMLQMLEADLEVIDSLSEWRRLADSDPKLLIKWANDFHTASGGRQVAAQLLTERMQRYTFMQELKPDTAPVFKRSVSKVGKKRIGQVNKKGEYGAGTVSMDFQSLLSQRRFEVIAQDPKALNSLPKRSEVVLIGDSENHSAVYGAGWPEIFMRTAGGGFRWGSRSGRISHAPNSVYLEVVPDFAVQPRVVVVTFMAKYFWDQTIPKPQRLPNLGEVMILGSRFSHSMLPSN